MANLQLSTGCRNSLLGGSTFDTDFNSGVLEIRNGTQPTAANDAPAGTVLASISLPADAFGAIGSGAIAKAGTWQDNSANASGTATWFRLKTSTDGGGSSTTDVRVDGDVSVTGGGGDLTLNNTSINLGQLVTITTFTITMPNS